MRKIHNLLNTLPKRLTFKQQHVKFCTCIYRKESLRNQVKSYRVTYLNFLICCSPNFFGHIRNDFGHHLNKVICFFMALLLLL